MLEINTEYGVFGDYKSLYYFMLSEHLDYVLVEVSYIFSNVFNNKLTLSQVKDMAF